MQPTQRSVIAKGRSGPREPGAARPETSLIVSGFPGAFNCPQLPLPFAFDRPQEQHDC